MAAAAASSAAAVSPPGGSATAVVASTAGIQAPAAAAKPLVPQLRHLPHVTRRDGKPPVSIVVATTGTGGIGWKGKLPWNLKTDMTFFRDITKSTRGAAGARNAAVMGRRTWAGIPPAFRPLRGRVNALLSLQDEKLVRE